MLDVAGAINSQTDVKINGVSVTEQSSQRCSRNGNRSRLITNGKYF